jgi:uncharacterized protein with gpF-like domain
MARYDLAFMARRAGTRRKLITFAPIITTKAQVSSLAANYRRMLAPWLDSRRVIEAAYARELDRVLQTDAIDDLTSLFAALAEEVNRLVLTLTPDLRDWALRVESWHRNRWANTVLAGANVDIRYLIGPADAQEAIEAVLARNAALVKDIGRQAEARISDAVFRGIQARTPAREVGKEIAEALGLARKRANRIAADQAVKLASALDRQRQREAGLDSWKWKHSGKLHPRLWHQKRDGKIYTDETAPEDEPGELPFCGCVRQAVLVIDGVVLG